MKSNYLGQAWLVIVLSLVFGGALAAVQTTLSAKIEQNKLDDTLSQIPRLVPGAKTGQELEIGNKKVYRAMDEFGEQVGWVVPAKGQGFADVITLLIGLDPNADQLTGLYVLEQKETPGLGSRIADRGTDEKKGFLWQFFYHGAKADRPLVVTKASPKMEEPGSENQIKAVSGATISSQSVCDIVNAAVKAMRKDLIAKARKD